MIPMLNLYTANVGISDLVAEVNKYGFERIAIYATNSPTEATSIEAICDSLVMGVSGSTADLSTFINLAGYRNGLSVDVTAISNYPDSIELWHTNNAFIGGWVLNTVSGITDLFDKGSDFVLTSSVLPSDIFVGEYTIFESDFMGNIAAAIPGLNGAALSSGSISVAYSTKEHPGVITISDSTTANGGYAFLSSIYSILLSGGEKSEIVFQVGVGGARTTAKSRLGFHNAITVPADPTFGAWIDIVGDGTKATISGKTNDNTGISTTSTTFTADLSTWYRGVVEINADATLVAFSIIRCSDNVTVWRDTLTTKIPKGTNQTTAWGIIAGETSTDAAAVVLHLDYANMSINRKLIR
jgi:hypothetical protein